MIYHEFVAGWTFHYFLRIIELVYTVYYLPTVITQYNMRIWVGNHRHAWILVYFIV